MGQNDKVNKEWIASGIPISNGLAIGKASIVRRFASNADKSNALSAVDVNEEISRIKQALQVLLVSLRCSEDFLLKHANSEAATVFSMQRAFLTDPILIGQFYEVIETKRCCAEAALRSVLDGYADRFAIADNPRVRERVSDIYDLRDMSLDALNNAWRLKPNLLRNKPDTHARIAVAFELTPRLVVEQNMLGVKGIITETGGQTSHAAILCQALGIPAITGIQGVTRKIEKNSPLLLNATEGKIHVSPSRKSVFGVLYSKLTNQFPRRLNLKSDNAFPLLLLATINFARESRNMAGFQSDGVGLYRTEMECLSLGRFLTEEEQVYRYMEVLENMEGRPVYIRLMDLGGDKKITSSGEEQHPVSGPRGSRYLLENPEVLKIQARAIARASINGCLNVIYPMITDNELFSAVKNKFLASTLLMKSGMIRHGVMFETPSACLQAHDLLREADFGSIGTNDLMEQLFNHSRNSDHAYKAASHPDLWKMIELVLKAAVDTGKPVFVCGELAKQPEFLSRFIKIGVSGISVPFKVIPDLRNHLMMKKNIPDAFEDAFLSPLNKPNNNPVD